MPKFNFSVNGATHGRDVDEDKPLLWVLREDLGLTGAKFGCGIAMCGACTVLIEDPDDPDRPHRMIPVRSCVLPAKAVDGRRIATIEGLSTPIEGLSPDIGPAVQQAWIEADVPQCGYCQSGQIMTTVALLDEMRRRKDKLKDDKGKLDDDVINAGLAGNLCRCGTYVRIREAVKAAAKALNIQVEG